MVTKREEIMQDFGPLLLESVTLIIMEELNILRVNAGMQPRTASQVLTAIESKQVTLERYPWQKKWLKKLEQIF